MLNTTHGREQRYQHSCCGTDPLDKQGDHDAKVTKLFFADYSPCYSCKTPTPNDELERDEFYNDWCCEKCRKEIAEMN